MKQRLCKTDGETLVYDDATGEVTGLADRTAKPNGTCYNAGDAVVALYVCAGELCLQIGETRFWVGDQALRFRYDNNWESGSTTVRFEDASSSVEIEYPGWWIELGLSTADAQAMPDRAFAVDGLAALLQVIEDQDWRLRVLANWGDADPALLEPVVDSVMDDVAAALADEGVSDELVQALAEEVLGKDQTEAIAQGLLGAEVRDEEDGASAGDERATDEIDHVASDPVCAEDGSDGEPPKKAKRRTAPRKLYRVVLFMPGESSEPDTVVAVPNRKEAIKKAKQIIQDSVEALVTPKIKFETLYENYEVIGPRLTIEADGKGGRVITYPFDTLDYARRMCRQVLEGARSEDDGSSKRGRKRVYRVMLAATGSSASPEMAASCSNRKEAMASAKEIIHAYVQKIAAVGGTSADLYEQYVAHGPRPTIESDGRRGRVVSYSFDVLAYARRVCGELGEPAAAVDAFDPTRAGDCVPPASVSPEVVEPPAASTPPPPPVVPDVVEPPVASTLPPPPSVAPEVVEPPAASTPPPPPPSVAPEVVEPPAASTPPPPSVAPEVVEPPVASTPPPPPPQPVPPRAARIRPKIVGPKGSSSRQPATSVRSKVVAPRIVSKPSTPPPSVPGKAKDAASPSTRPSLTPPPPPVVPEPPRSATPPPPPVVPEPPRSATPPPPVVPEPPRSETPPPPVAARNKVESTGQYRVMVEGQAVASFADYREAQAKAQQVIEDFAAGLVTPGIKAVALYAQYLDCGPRPTIESESVTGRLRSGAFDALDYAQEVCTRRAEQARKPEVGQLIPVAEEEPARPANPAKPAVGAGAISLALPAMDSYRVMVRDLSTGAAAQAVASLPSHKAAILIANQVIADFVESLLASGVQVAELYTKYAEMGPRPTIESDAPDGQVVAHPFDALANARELCEQKIAELAPPPPSRPSDDLSASATAVAAGGRPQQVEIRAVDEAAAEPAPPAQKVYRVMSNGRGANASPEVVATFEDRNEAVDRAKQVIEAYVEGLVTPTMEASELYSRFLQLGPKLTIESDGPGQRVLSYPFNALDYARRMCKQREESAKPPSVPEQIAAALDQIEGEMQRVGLWDGCDLSPEAEAIRATYDEDVSTLAQWMQYRFMPTMRQCQASGSPFPSDSGVRKKATRDFGGRDHLEHLVGMLQKLDGLLRE